MVQPGAGRASAALGIALISALFASCTHAATEVLVVVDTDLAGPSLSMGIVVRRGTATIAEGTAFDRQWSRTPASDAGAAGLVLPATFGIVPRDGEPHDDVVTLRVEAIADTVRVARVVRFRFVPNTLGSIRVFLSARCAAIDTRCGPACTREQFCEQLGQTCGDTGECTDVMQTTMPVDAGSDAGLADAASDVGSDLATDIPSIDSATCPPGQVLCGGTCTAVTSDPAHCGATCATCPAGPAATATCSAGMCGLACTAGFLNCDGVPSNGCETNPQTDRTNCGACNVGCAATEQCVGGICITPCASLVAIAAMSASIGGGAVCSPGNVLARDGTNYCGLDYTTGLGFGTIAGRTESSCVVADWGSVLHMGTVTVSARPSHGACGTACTTSCDTGDDFDIFIGQTLGTYTFVANQTMPPLSVATDYPFVVSTMARYVVVCRTSGGAARDDVAIDVIEVRCP